MQRIKIGIVEDSPGITNMLVDFICGDSGLELVFTATDGLSAVSDIERLRPDIVLLDIILPELDGFGVMEEVRGPKPKFLVMSALSQESFINKSMRLGADYYILKPFSFEVLKNRIMDMSSDAKSNMHNRSIMDSVMNDFKSAVPSSKNPKNRTMEERITNIFITVGIPAHIKGYQFLREAIKLAIDNPEIINCITKKLYPSIADRFATSASKVERAIRHAIEVAWNRGKIENINSLFGVKVYSNNEKPTNGEFIALVADKMLIEGA